MTMFPDERSLHGRSAHRLHLPGEQTLIAIIAALFLILHILAGSLLQRAAAGQPPAPREEAPMSLDD